MIVISIIVRIQFSIYSLITYFLKLWSILKINFNNLISSDLGNVCPKCTSCRSILEIK